MSNEEETTTTTTEEVDTKLLLFPREVLKLDWYKDLSNDSKALFWEYYSRCNEEGYAEVTPLEDTQKLKLDNHDNAFVPVMKALSWVNHDGNLVTGYDPEKGMRVNGKFTNDNTRDLVRDAVAVKSKKRAMSKKASKAGGSIKLTPQDEIEITKAFDKFWDRYPNKVAKTVAFKTWMKLKPKADTRLFNDIMLGLQQHNKQQTWKDAVKAKDLKFIPHPSTWLNGERWQDEVVTVPDEDEAREIKEERLAKLKKDLNV